MDLNRQLRALLVLEGLWSFRLGGAVWVLLLSARGFSLAEIGLAEGLFHLVSLLGEVPSGLCADLLGRRRALAASQGMFFLSAVVMALTSGLPGVLVSMALSALGYNLASGTREALTYDSLLQRGEEGRYLAFSSRQNVVYRLGTAAATLCAALALWLGYRASYAVDAALSLLGLAVALSLAEPVVTDGQRTREEGPLSGLARRLPAYLRETGRFLRENPRVVALMLFNALAGACATLLGFYLQDALPARGAPAGLLGPLLLLVGLGGAVGSRLSVPLARLPYAGAGVVCCAAIAAGYLLCAFGPYPAMAAGGLAAAVGDDALELLTDARLNARLPSDQRATLISVSSLCFSLTMALLSPLAGWLVSL